MKVICQNKKCHKKIDLPPDGICPLCGYNGPKERDKRHEKE